MKVTAKWVLFVVGVVFIVLISNVAGGGVFGLHTVASMLLGWLVGQIHD